MHGADKGAGAPGHNDQPPREGSQMHSACHQGRSCLGDGFAGAPFPPLLLQSLSPHVLRI